MDGDTDKHKYEEVRWSLFVPASQLVARMSLLFAFPSSASCSLSHRRRLVAITTKHCTVHMSVTWRRAGVVAWARATYQYHVNGTDTVGQSRISLCTDIAHEKKIAGLPHSWSLRNLTPRISEFLHANLHQRVCSRSREKRTSKHGISMIISSQY